MAKKISPKEIIEEEASKNPNREYGFAKFPGKELIPITSNSEEGQAEMDEKKMEELEKVYGSKRNRLHTHPYDPDTTMVIKGKKDPNQRVSPDIPLPSDQDLGGFLDDPRAKSAYIAQYNSKTGKVEGYFVIRKTSKTPISGVSRLEKYAVEKSKGDKASILKMLYHLGRSAISIIGTDKRVGKYGEEISKGVINDNPEEVTEALDKMSHRYHLRYRFVPARDYKVSKYKTHIVRESDNEGELEGKVAGMVAIIGLLGSIIFLSPNLTGNVVSNLSLKNSNIIGAVLFLIAIIGVFFYYLKKKI